MEVDMAGVCGILLFTKNKLTRCLEQLGVGKSAEIKNFLLQQHQQQKSGIQGGIVAGSDSFGLFIVIKDQAGQIKVHTGNEPPPPSPFFYFIGSTSSPKK